MKIEDEFRTAFLASHRKHLECRRRYPSASISAQLYAGNDPFLWIEERQSPAFEWSTAGNRLELLGEAHAIVDGSFVRGRFLAEGFRTPEPAKKRWQGGGDEFGLSSKSTAFSILEGTLVRCKVSFRVLVRVLDTNANPMRC